MEKTSISKDEYKKIEHDMGLTTTYEELIDLHKKLVGKTCKFDTYEIKDCGVESVKKLLSSDWGRSIVYSYSKRDEDFIHSKYLSDYFKNSIKELLSNEELSDIVINAINSDKLINDMSEEEIKEIYSSIKDFYKKQDGNESYNVARYIMSLLYKLDGKGVTSFIKNEINKVDLATNILLTSGLTDRASYYSGRGVNQSDLNSQNLVSIFTKLLKLDENYAIEFVEMVKQMKTLGATEFINTFMNFATNGFKTSNLEVDNNNISLDGAYGEARDAVAFFSIFSAMSRGDDSEYQINASEDMKRSFISEIEPIIMKINKEYYNQLYNYFGYNESYGGFSYRKR